jgi:hypothetical protein
MLNSGQNADQPDKIHQIEKIGDQNKIIPVFEIHHYE